MSNMNKYEKLLYKRNKIARHCGKQMDKIVELKQKLQEKDNLIDQLKNTLNDQIEYTKEICKERDIYKSRCEKALQKLKAAINHFHTERENNVITFTINILKGKGDE